MTDHSQAHNEQRDYLLEAIRGWMRYYPSKRRCRISCILTR